MTRVVAIGGGHGLAMTLRAVRRYAGHVTAVVATSDDGGSSGRLRRELDLPAPGDLRRCLSAIAGDDVIAAGFEHRFSAGDLEGHALGNLVLAGLVDAGHDLAAAARLASTWLGIDPDRATVLPATCAPVTLIGVSAGGEIHGQVAVEATESVRSIRFAPPDPDVPHDAVRAITDADQIVLGPGSFLTSVLAAASVPGIAKAIEGAAGRVVLVANLDADVADHVEIARNHGLRVDQVITQTPAESPAGGGAPAIGDVRVVVADVDRPHGLAHDADLLAQVLASLASNPTK